MNNKDKESYRKEYYNKNKDKWYEEKTCEICKCKYTNSTKYRHFKSKKHELNVLKQSVKELNQNIQNINNKINNI